MKMRYCFLISAVVSIIICGVLSYFIEIWASVYASIFSCYIIALIIFVKSSEEYKNGSSKFKGVMPTMLCGLLGLYDVAFARCYKGERTIIFAILVGVIFAICLSISTLILLRKDKGDTK